jgi:hypothetical protein
MVVLLSKYPDGLMVSSTSAIYPVDDPNPRQVVPNRRGLVWRSRIRSALQQRHSEAVLFEQGRTRHP